MYDAVELYHPTPTHQQNVAGRTQVRHLGLAPAGQGGVAAFINKALTPPGEAALGNALTLLARIGAFRANESLTPLVSAENI